MSVDGWPGEKLLIRLWETLEKAGYGFLKPAQIERVESARTKIRVERILAITQAKKFSQDILSGKKVYQDGRLLSVRPVLAIDNDESPKDGMLVEFKPNSQAQNEILPNIASVLIAKEFSRAANIEIISLMAEEELEKTIDKNAQDKSVDEDWFVNWRNRAQDISNEEMQGLWAKVLAGEVADPGRYSIHTLDLLSKLTVKEAKIIEEFAPFAAAGSIFRTDDCKKVIFKDIKFDKLVYLHDLGIVSSIHELGGIERFFKPGYENSVGIFLRDDMVLVIEDVSEQIQVPAFPLSTVGNELFSLTKIPVNSDYTNAIASHFKQKGHKTYLASIVRRKEDGITEIEKIRDL